MADRTSTRSRGERRADRRQTSAERTVDRMLDQMASGSGVVALAGVALLAVAGLGLWIVDTRHRTVGIVLVVVWALGIVLIVLAASIAARYEYRIARIEGATRSSAVWRATRAWFRSLLFWMP